MNHSEVINNTSAKQTIQLHPGQHFFSKKKKAALGGTRTHDTLQSRQSALPTELYPLTLSMHVGHKPILGCLLFLMSGICSTVLVEENTLWWYVQYVRPTILCEPTVQGYTLLPSALMGSEGTVVGSVCLSVCPLLYISLH